MDTEKLIEQLEASSPQNFLSTVQEAIQCAQKYHTDQFRLSGEPYVNHGLRTAITLAQMGMDTDTIIAGLLHNSTTNTTLNTENISKEITEKFGENVYKLLTSCNGINRATASTETDFPIITRYILNSSKDLRPVLIKLADTLDNVRTIEYMPKDRLSSKLQKILYIYAPLAEYLNLDRLKKELEEKALKIYRPEIYQMIREKMDANSFTQDVKFKYIEYISKILSEISPTPAIYGRVKSIYSIYNKQRKQLKEGISVDLSNIRDLIAFRIVTDTENNCFKILEKIMDNGDILTEEFDDYISHPKPNGYKALQGPVTLPEVSPNIVEIQILTHDMHYFNTYGSASHIAYKESLSSYAKPTDKYSWVEDVHKEISNNISKREDQRSIPILVDIFPTNVYAFTPKGKIIQLDKGDTVVDFAYKVHTDVGNSMVSAKVNNQAVKLDYQVLTGDIVEIKTQLGKKSVKPDWLKYANSPSTHYRIQRSWKKS